MKGAIEKRTRLVGLSALMTTLALFCLLVLSCCIPTTLGKVVTENDAQAQNSAANAQAGQVESSGATDSGTEAPIATGICVVRYIDVGQGDSTLVECNGQYMLIDGGPTSASSKVYSVLKDEGIGYLDYIVATHPDSDHIGGIPGALNYAMCGTLFCSTDQADTKIYQSVVNHLASGSGIGVTVPSVGTEFTLGTAKVEIIGPTKQFQSDNDNSLIVKVTFGDTTFLFTGDAESSAETALARLGDTIDVDVLQVGHHGSSSSSTITFLKKVTPIYAVVSVGDNSYGHPTNKALSNLQSVGATVLRTDELGDIVFTSDGTKLSYTTAKG